ncbi:MAG TPA: hypothetical protein VM890_02600 [Longimicrobium sp.]|jgi:hypothetical protein|nr:hypothetical protein [Longimicrobium sp.]
MAATALLAACADQDPTTLTAPEAVAPLTAPAAEAKTVPDRHIGAPNRPAFTGTNVPLLGASIYGEKYIHVYDDNDWDYHTWTSSVSGGTAPYTYQWAVRYPDLGLGYGGAGNGTSATFGVQSADGDLELRLIVTSADGQSTTEYYYVEVTGPGSSCGPGVITC